jgi:UDP-2-acetamido-3-amino-2,3-dideoxy-glucuronate N-acetyltransferase
MPTLVKRGATLGANSTIVCGVTIGEFAFIGAGAVVTKDIPAYALVVGNPARQLGWMGEFGVRLEKGHLPNQWVCPSTKNIYIESKGTLVPSVKS